MTDDLQKVQQQQLTADVSCSHCKLNAVQSVLILPPSHQDPDQRQECEWGDDMRESFAFVANPPSILPDWIQQKMESSGWTKGKLYCQKCQLHIGSFNFTNEMKCLHCRQTFGSSLYFLCGNVNIIYCNNNNNNSVNCCPSPLPSSATQSTAATNPPLATSATFFHSHPNVSPLHDPFHPESPTISTLDLATSDAETFDQSYDRICAELSLIIDPLHPDNLRISSEQDTVLRAVRSSPNSLVSLGGVDVVSDDSDALFMSDFDSVNLASPEFTSIRSCFPTSVAAIGHQRRHSLTLSNLEAPVVSGTTVNENSQASFFVSTHETNLNLFNRRYRNSDLTYSASNSPSSRRRPLGHPRMVSNQETVARNTNVVAASCSSSAAVGVNDQSSSSDEEIYSTELAREYQCPICLEIMYYPVSCKPCHHKFCGFCLKTQACESVATTTKCAVCRSYIHHVVSLDELATKLKECFSNVYRKRAKQINSRFNSGNSPNMEALPFPGFHAGKNSYQICCCIAYIHASKHRKKYMAILQALLYFVVIGLPIFTLIIATVFSQ